MMLRDRAYTSEAKEKKFKVNGKTGVWRTVADNPVFFPDDGSKPTGVPKFLKGKPKDLDDAGEISDKMADMKKTTKEWSDHNIGAGPKGVDKTLKDGGEEAEKGMDDLEKGSDTPEAKSFLNKAIGNAVKVGIGGALLAAFPALIGYGLMFVIAAGVAKSMKGKLGGVFESKSNFKAKLGKEIESGVRDVFAKIQRGKIDSKKWKAALAKARKHTKK